MGWANKEEGEIKYRFRFLETDETDPLGNAVRHKTASGRHCLQEIEV
jgi:hypothetical protein